MTEQQRRQGPRPQPHAGGRWQAKEKPKDFRSAWMRLFPYLGSYRWTIALGVACSLAASLISLMGPGMLEDLTDTVWDSIVDDSPVDMGKVTSIGLCLAALYAVTMAFTWVDNYIMHVSAQRLSARIRSDLSAKIDRVPVSVFDRSSTGDVMSRLTNDADTIARGVGQSIDDLLSGTVLMVGAAAFMLSSNWVLAIVAAIPAGLGFWFLYVAITRSQKYYVSQSRNLGRMQGHVDEVYSGHTVVKAYGGEKAARERFDRINSELYVTAYRTRFLSNMMPKAMEFVGSLGYVAVCLVGSYMVIDPIWGVGATFGTISAFIIYERQFTSPMTDIAQSLNTVQSVAASAERVFEFLDLPEMEEPEDPRPLPAEVKGKVEFRDVHFSYVPGREVIHGLSLVADPGEKVAIVGPTGAGKTTIVNLLMRFYEPDSGEILVDGVPISEMTRRDVRSMFTMVLQSATIFDATLRDNVAYGSPGITDEEVMGYLRDVGLEDYVGSLPDGLDTRMGDGSRMSAGQRQQVTVARALARRTPLLILDEATSSVDTRTERTIQEAMARLTRGRTSFVIAHRLSTVRDADVILVVRDGGIVEQGTHDELMAKGGFYKTLYDSQFEGCD